MVSVVVIASLAGAGRATAQGSGWALPTAGVGDRVDGVSGPRAVRTVALSGRWAFKPLQTFDCTWAPVGPEVCAPNRPVAGGWTTIEVPGGGWVKQGFRNVAEAVYRRAVTVPDTGRPQVTELEFGAINHRARLSIDGRVVGTLLTIMHAGVHPGG